MHNSRLFDLEDALKRTMGNILFLKEMLDEFQNALPGHLADIQAAIDRGDMDRLEKGAHQLKGTAANLGATAVAGAALALEKIGKNGQATQANQALAQLEYALDAFTEEIQQVDWSAYPDSAEDP